jgi:hypothetical protein
MNASVKRPAADATTFKNVFMFPSIPGNRQTGFCPCHGHTHHLPGHTTKTPPHQLHSRLRREEKRTDGYSPSVPVSARKRTGRGNTCTRCVSIVRGIKTERCRARAEILVQFFRFGAILVSADSPQPSWAEIIAVASIGIEEFNPHLNNSPLPSVVLHRLLNRERHDRRRAQDCIFVGRIVDARPESVSDQSVFVPLGIRST